MFRLYSLLLFVFFVFSSFLLNAQPDSGRAGGQGYVQAEGQSGDRFIDSLKLGLSKAQTPSEKVQYLLELALSSYMDPLMGDLYVSRAMETAELSRDRRLMGTTYMTIGRRYMNNPGLSDNLERAVSNFNRAAAIAKANDLELLQVRAYSELSTAWIFKGDRQKGLEYCNQELSIAGTSLNDTTKAMAYASMGDYYLSADEKLLAFRNFLEALQVAEKSNKESLLSDAWEHLSRFYASIGEYGKAIDYRMMMYQQDSKAGRPLDIIRDMYSTGDLFTRSKQPDLALKMYEKAILFADSMHYDLLKVDPYFRIFNMYFNLHQYSKGYSYLMTHQSIVIFLQNMGYQYFLDQLYAMSMTELKKFDSAGYYFRRAEPDMDRKSNPEQHYNFYTAVGDYNIQKRDYPQAIASYLKAYRIGEETKDLEEQENCSMMLDSVYGLAGDYRSAHLYNIRYHAVKDSLRDMSRDADLLKMEVENDNQRRERLAREEEERVEHRHNLQYLGFTIGLVALFVALVMLGWFAVPAGFIRALGFVSFIFLFEFIILLADKSIQRWTHDEPWMVLMIKIGLAAVLVPLHHWLEHKVIHYLSHRKRIIREKEVQIEAS
jgi:tetratricopeptide (TPR) repeat protein